MVRKQNSKDAGTLLLASLPLAGMYQLAQQATLMLYHCITNTQYMQECYDAVMYTRVH